MSVNTGSDDGTELSRLFQQNVTILTAFDPSNFFAQLYTRTLNTFLATNILPGMFGFTDDAGLFDLIKQYLNTFCDNNINNEDQKIAEAAKQIATIIAGENGDKGLHDSIEIIRSLAGATEDMLALPWVAANFVDAFTIKFPRLATFGELFGSLLLTGITGFAIFNLFAEWKEWKDYGKLSKAELFSLANNTAQLGLQVVGAIVKRGVRIYAIFDGLTGAARAAAIGKILITGEVQALDQGLLKIGNSFARWLGDTQETISN